MPKQISAGFILFEPESGTILATHPTGRPLGMRLAGGGHMTSYDIPKGHIEEGETAIQAAKRELFEETGLRCGEFTEVFTRARDDSGSLFTLFFARTDCDPASVRMQEGETVDYRWIDRAELEDMLDAPDVVTHLRRDFEACVAMGLID